MINMHDIPGTHDSWVHIGSFGTADDGKYAAIFRAPFDCYVKRIEAWFDAAIATEGTTSGSACFAFIANYGTVENNFNAFATADVAGGTALSVTRQIGCPMVVFNGTQSLNAGNYLTLKYDAGFSPAIALGTTPAFIRVAYEGR